MHQNVNRLLRVSIAIIVGEQRALFGNMSKGPKYLTDNHCLLRDNMGTSLSILSFDTNIRPIKGNSVIESLRIPPNSSLQLLLLGANRDHFYSFVKTQWGTSTSRTPHSKQDREYAQCFLDFWVDTRDFQTMPSCAFQVSCSLDTHARATQGSSHTCA